MNNNIQSLVEEALKEINNVSIDANQVRKILTSLAEKASQNGLQLLPDVDTLMNDIYMNTATLGPIGSKDIAEYLHSKYGTPPAEWWMKLKKGDKFVTYEGKTVIFTDHLLEYTDDSIYYHRVCASSSSPYTEPTTLEHFMATLTPEQRELAKSLTIQEGGGLEK